MSNLLIKKAIKEATKKIDDYRIELQLWRGDGTFHPQGIVINNEVNVYDNEKEEEILNLYYGISNEGNEVFENNIEKLRKEQKKMLAYLKKHFDVEIIIKELVI